MLFIDSLSPLGSSYDGLPPTAPIPAVLQTLACRLRPLPYLKWCRAQLGERFVVYPLDMPPLVFLCNSEDIRAIFTAPADVLLPGAGAAVAAPLFGGRSFMLAEGDTHMAVRAAITPALHRRVVEESAELVRAIVADAARAWPQDRVFSAHRPLRALALRVILRTIFGEEGALHRALHHCLLEMLEVASSLVLQEPRVRHLPGWHATWRRFVRWREQADGLVLELVRARREHLGERWMLDMLLASPGADGGAMSDSELRDHLVSLIIAGHETTASALAWALQLLAHHRPAQDRLAEEIASDDGEQYMTATIQEVLRHSPVFLFAAPRAVARPVEIGGWTYHPPAQLLACTYLLHHDPDLYPEPEMFRPERFLGAQPRPRLWLPWGGGRRVCLGRHLAIQEIKLVLRAILGERRIEPVGRAVERPAWRTVMVAPGSGCRVILRRRPLRRSASRVDRATVGAMERGGSF